VKGRWESRWRSPLDQRGEEPLFARGRDPRALLPSSSHGTSAIGPTPHVFTVKDGQYRRRGHPWLDQPARAPDYADHCARPRMTSR